jgi:hypothetical protein
MWFGLSKAAEAIQGFTVATLRQHYLNQIAFYR